MKNKIIRIFLASPGDTNPERNIVEKVVSELNNTFKDTIVRFEVIRWENMPPMMGRPQNTVNTWAQIENCDVFIGILWKKFGTPTGAKDINNDDFESGTQEEFDIAYKAWKTNQKPKIFFFKSTKAASPQSIDANQLKKVTDFFNEFKYDKKHPGIYNEYKTNMDFEKKIRNSLITYALDFILNENNSLEDFQSSLSKYGFENIFVPELNDERNVAKSKSLGQTNIIYLIAHSGFSFIAQFGHRFRNIVEEKLKEGHEFKAILTNPWSESGFFISMSETPDKKVKNVLDVIENANWYKVKFQDSINGYIKLRKKYGDNIQIRFTRFEIPSSILLTDDNCFIEPYLPVNLEKRYEKGMLTFELQLSNSSYLYHHNQDYFKFLWEISDDIDAYYNNMVTYKEHLKNKLDFFKEG